MTKYAITEGPIASMSAYMVADQPSRLTVVRTVANPSKMLSNEMYRLSDVARAVGRPSKS